jgi:hypothetical protein
MLGSQSQNLHTLLSCGRDGRAPSKALCEILDVNHTSLGTGVKKLADKAGVVCQVKYPDHPTQKYKDIWDFIVQESKAQAK